MWSLLLHIFYSKSCHFFFVLLYKGRLERLPKPTWETFPTCIIVLDKLCEDFGCFIMTDFISTKSAFSIVFGSCVVIFNRFTDFVFFFSLQIGIIVFFSITRINSFFLLIWLHAVTCLFFQTFHWIIIAFFKKSNSFISPVILCKKIAKP